MLQEPGGAMIISLLFEMDTRILIISSATTSFVVVSKELSNIPCIPE
jgi:hypothetical protein